MLNISDVPGLTTICPFVKSIPEYLNALSNTTNPSSNILEHKGDIEFKLGQKENAIEYWKKAFLKNPTNKILERKTREGILIE